MNDPTLFSNNNYNTVVYVDHFISKYKRLFRWNSSEDILEIGCSNGRITKEILYPFAKDHFRHLIASDICETAIENANKTNNFLNLSFRVMDITDETECGKYAEKFGHIFAFYLFHVVHRYDLWSKNVYKMLKPNGQLFATILLNPNICTETVGAQKKDKSTPWSKYIENLPDLMHHFGPTPIETVSDILRDVGFVIDAIDVETIPASYKGLEPLKNTFLGVNSFLPHIPRELHDLYIEDYMDKVFQHVTVEDGIYSHPLTTLSLLATKN